MFEKLGIYTLTATSAKACGGGCTVCGATASNGAVGPAPSAGR